jgi:cytochrome b561
MKNNGPQGHQHEGKAMVTGYSRAQISLHWAVALLIVYQLIFGEDMTGVWRSFERSGTTTMTTGAWIHIIAGVLVLAFAIWRLALRLTRGVPAAPPGESAALKLAGDAGHWALYLLMLALPITGLLAWYGGVTSLANVHGEVLKTLLIVLMILHVVAAFFHHFVLKDGLLNRMRKPG